MQCPGCDYIVTGKQTGFPSTTHCCLRCEREPGTHDHGNRCARLLSLFAEVPKVCPGCHKYFVTGVSLTHCCLCCERGDGYHGDRCQRRPVSQLAQEEYATSVLHRTFAARALSSPPAHESAAHVSTVSLHRFAYVALLFGRDAEYTLGALLLASSLRRSGSLARIVLLHTQDVPETALTVLRHMYDEVRLLCDPIRLPRDSPLCVSGRDFGHPQFMKLHLLELDFEKVLYLDCDIVVRRSLDHLFALEAPAAMERIMAMPRHGDKLPNRVFWGSMRIRGIQGGVMLLSPDRQLFAELRAEVESWRCGDGRYFKAGIGNEQDYLTWRLGGSDERLDEYGHVRVWTHLGCEYNYEIHRDVNYYGYGRERWLKLDYEQFAAVLHFSAPCRKRGKHLLCSHDGSTDKFESSGDARLDFGATVWHEAINHLRCDLTVLGFSLDQLMGVGRTDAHIISYCAVDMGVDGGMELRELRHDELTSVGYGLIFEAWSSNCSPGLQACPPFLPVGPPWGVSFWARHVCSHSPSKSSSCEFDVAACADTGTEGEAGERSFWSSGAAADVGGQPIATRSPQTLGPSTGSTGNDIAPVPAEGAWRCTRSAASGLPSKLRTEDFGHAGDTNGNLADTDGLGVIGAWLHRSGGERWLFGLLSDPPHEAGCLEWDLTVTFAAKVLRV